MIRKIERKWFEVWGEVDAQNQLLKYLLVVFAFISAAELTTIAYLSLKKPILITVNKENSNWNGYSSPDPELLQKEIERVIIKYLKARHSWQWQNIDSSIKEASSYVGTEMKNKFLTSMQEQIKIAKEKQISQKIYPEISNLNLKEKTAQIQCERILFVNGIRASQPLNLELVYEFSDRTELNPEGIYIISEKVLSETR